MASLPVIVGKISEIPPGGRKIVVPYRGRAGIGVFNINGSYYAVRNICPHKHGPLCMGEVSGRSFANAPPSSPGADLSFDEEGEVLRCPWHSWSFQITTGQCLVDPDMRVKTYPVRIDGEDIVVGFDEGEVQP
jgi:nitrite reductase (NADH) small subunit